MSTILFHAREAGVATMFSALAEPLQRQGYELIYDVDGHAANIITNKPKSSSCEADIIICGYDIAVKDATGKYLNKIKNTIPTLGLLDSWKGVDRFWYANGKMRPLTDRLIVPDDSIRNYLIQKGVPDKWPVVCGHPYIETLTNVTLPNRESLKNVVRNKFKLEDDKRVMLLMSEPLNMGNGQSTSLLNRKMMDGRGVMEWLDDLYGKEYRLAVRKHPLEEAIIPEKWLDISAGSLADALSLADHVCGLGSTTLAYAVAYGLDVSCLDQEVEDWVPEQSNIPTSLWNDLIINGIFQNQPNRISEKPSFPSFSSTELILIEIMTMLEGSKIN